VAEGEAEGPGVLAFAEPRNLPELAAVDSGDEGMSLHQRKHNDTTGADRRRAKCEDVMSVKTGTQRGHLLEPVRTIKGSNPHQARFRCRRCGGPEWHSIKNKHGDKINTRRSDR